MSDTNTPVTKRTIRRKVATTPVATTESVTSIKNIDVSIQAFSDLISKISDEKEELERLQKEIMEARSTWIKEQKDHELKLLERNQQEEIARKREEETYTYETTLSRKKVEDEFSEKKAKWEKELAERKGEIEKDKQELEALRKQVTGFESEKEKTVKEAVSILQKELTDRFAIDKKLSEQEFRAEKEVLNLKINHLTTENARLNNEMNTLRKALEEATKQVKDIAVKVIESSNTGTKVSSSPEE